MDYKNLSSKTIFDFTSDPAVIESLFGFYDPKDEKWKADYIREMKADPDYNAFELVRLSEKIGDDNLFKAVENQFPDYHRKIFNE